MERNLAALPGIVLRSALRAVIAGAGIGDVAGIELRPGSDRLYGPAGLGHSLRLPTMPHRVEVVTVTRKSAELESPLALARRVVM